MPTEATAIIHLAGKAHDTSNTSDPEEYFKVNRDLTIELFDLFLRSDIKDFFYFSSVKAVADTVDGILVEDVNGSPLTPLCKSKTGKRKQYLFKEGSAIRETSLKSAGTLFPDCGFNSTEFNKIAFITLRGMDPYPGYHGVLYENMNLRDIPVDNIENINVLKGATATALYGERGAGGAIMVTTKKGLKSKGTEISVSTNNMFFSGYLALPSVQSSYSAGYGGKFNTDDEVWGDKLDIGRRYPDGTDNQAIGGKRAGV
ncbi:hypothetical protein FQR65_LT17463 [Abscondita terminalis]|nr:hypothetical protein FQR65_LT17463 [Abscondita terminalis]